MKAKWLNGLMPLLGAWADSVWSANPERAYALAEQMDSTVWINKHAELDPTIPFGGAKMSGLGNELGRKACRSLPVEKSQHGEGLTKAPALTARRAEKPPLGIH